MFRSNIRNSWNRSNVFSRKTLYVPPNRGVDLSPAASVGTSPDAVKEPNNVEGINPAVGKTTDELGVSGKENVSSVSDSNDTIVVQNPEIEESSVNEKKIAKRKKQKENKFIHGYDVQNLSGDSWTLEGALKYCGSQQKPTKESSEVTEDKKKTKKCPSKQALETGLIENDSGFGDCYRHGTLGLASVKSGLITPSSELSEGSEIGKNISECSEVMSPSELDIDDIFRSLVTDKTAGNDACIGNLPSTLDQQSSVTDSSGVEMSSDADSDHVLYVIDSADSKSDVPNGQFPELHQPEDSACEQEAGFITVSKKRKPRSLTVDRKGENTPPFSSTDLVSPDSGESSPRQDLNASISPLPNSSNVKLLESRLSLGSTADTRLDSEPCYVGQSATSFDARHQSSETVSMPPERSSSAEQRTSSLSDIGLDDFAFSCLLKETSLEDDWTVVKNGRRPRNHVQSTVDPSALGDNKQSVPVNVGHCSVIQERNVCEYGRGKASTNSGRDRPSSTQSRCKSFDGSNSKTFDHCWHDNGMKTKPEEASQKNFFPSGAARSSFSNGPKYRDANCDILSRCNSNREVRLLERTHSVPVRCQDIPRFSQKYVVPKSVVPVRNNCAIVASSSEGTKAALITMTAEPAGDRTRNTEGLSSEKNCLSTEISKSSESSSSKLPAAETTFIRRGTFTLIEAQVYLYREYQEVLKERQQIPHLVVIYNCGSEL